jgi:hypothetical protein
VIARGGMIINHVDSKIKVFLDILYPFSGFINLTLAIIISGLSFNYLGGKFKYDVISILLGLSIMFVADFIFSYTTTIGTYYSGNFGDLMLTLGLFFITYGVLGFSGLKDQ